MTWLLVFIPVTIGLEVFAPDRYLLVFIASCLAILPLAGWLGRATERLAARLGEGVGALLNATFGNAAELIIAFVALRAGLYDIVKASIAGCIVGNILLVLGAAMLAGGWNRPEQRFNPAGARSQATMLTLAAIALVSRVYPRHPFRAVRGLLCAGSKGSSCISRPCCCGPCAGHRGHRVDE
jgi:Ca2+:H+ antiporter